MWFHCKFTGIPKDLLTPQTGGKFCLWFVNWLSEPDVLTLQLGSCPPTPLPLLAQHHRSSGFTLPAHLACPCPAAPISTSVFVSAALWLKTFATVLSL